MLLFVDSFDHLDTATINRKGYAQDGSVSMVTLAAVGRNGTNGLRYHHPSTTGNGRCVLGIQHDAGDATFIAQFSIRRSGLTNTCPMLTIMRGSDCHLFFNIGASGAIEVRRASLGGNNHGSGTVLATSTETIPSGVHTYIRIKVVLSTSATGSVFVDINGTEAINISSVQTATNAPASWNGLQWGTGVTIGFGHTATYEYDDLIVMDGVDGTADQGQPFNDVIVDHVVACRLPDASGHHNGWIPTSGANYTNVDEVPPDNETSQVSAQVIGTRDTYGFADVGYSGDVTAVQVCAYTKANQAGVRQLRIAAREGGVDGELPGAHLVAADWEVLRFLSFEHPVLASGWSTTNLDATEFGPLVSA